MKITRTRLKQIIKEELQEMATSNVSVKSEKNDQVRVVTLTVNGKVVQISFSNSGGSPLVSETFYEELSEQERSEVMQKAQDAAGLKGMGDYSPDEMAKMMGGEELPRFKPLSRVQERKKR